MIIAWMLLMLSTSPQDSLGTMQAYETVLSRIQADFPGNSWSFVDRRVAVGCGWHCMDAAEVGTHSPEVIARLKRQGLIQDSCTPARNQTGCRVHRDQKSVGLSPLQILPDGSANVYAVLGLTRWEDEDPDVRSMQYHLQRGCDGKWRVVEQHLLSIT